MRFSKTSKIEGCAAKTQTRYSIDQVYLDCERRVMVATDGHMLAVVPVELDADDETGFVSTQALKSARGIGSKHADASIVANGSLALADGSTLPRPVKDGYRFPEWDRMLPNDEAVATVCLDAALLHKLADALGTKAVMIELRERGTPLRVFPIIGGVLGSYGLLMPISGD